MEPNILKKEIEAAINHFQLRKLRDETLFLLGLLKL